jgi:hypothetical protein
MRCSDVSRRATDYSQRALGPLATWTTRRHLAGCSACSAYVAQLQLTARALPRLALEPVPESQQAAALAVFRQWQARPERAADAEIVASPSASAATAAPGFAPLVVITGLVAGIGLTLSRHPPATTGAWLIAGVLAGAACCLMLLARRSGMAAALFATLAAAVAALVANHGSLDAAAGVHCAIVELLTAAIPLAALALWRRAEGISRASVAGVAAAGALAGDATLHISCSAADSVLHLLVFHVGGVALAAALAGLIAGRLLRLGPASA